jgi:hypothetical protein
MAGVKETFMKALLLLLGAAALSGCVGYTPYAYDTTYYGSGPYGVYQPGYVDGSSLPYGAYGYPYRYPYAYPYAYSYGFAPVSPFFYTPIRPHPNAHGHHFGHGHHDGGHDGRPDRADRGPRQQDRGPGHPDRHPDSPRRH